MGDDRKRIVGNNIIELGQQVSTTNAADLRPSQWNLESFGMKLLRIFLKAGHTQTPAESQKRVHGTCSSSSTAHTAQVSLYMYYN